MIKLKKGEIMAKTEEEKQKLKIDKAEKWAKKDITKFKAMYIWGLVLTVVDIILIPLYIIGAVYQNWILFSISISFFVIFLLVSIALCGAGFSLYFTFKSKKEKSQKFLKDNNIII